MLPRLIDANYVDRFTLYLCFSDGSEGEIDLEGELDGEIFEPLKDIFYFKNFVVNRELHTITWPNGADFSPEFLYDKLKVIA
ncbi:MAG TPA: DUF2442 domain-containing protein [Deltaproteobacteria bacterium]|nr:DUF2442 domain-containing protein [Deltaproteobacteria bacterium]